MQIQISPQSTALASGAQTGAGIAGAEAGLETGQFDFMNYLLGLESPALDLILPDASANQLQASGLSDGGEAKEDPLMDVFGKQGTPLWNAMFPNGTVQANRPDPLDKTGLVERTAVPNQKLDADLKKELLTTKDMAESAPTPKTEKREESTQTFLQTHEDLSKAPLEVKPLKERVIQKYAPVKEVETKVVEQAPDKTEKVVAKIVDKPEGVASLTKGPAIQAQVKAEMPEEKRRVDDDENREVSGLEFSQKPLAHSRDLKIEARDAKPHSIPEVFQKVESMVHHGGGKMTVSLSPEDLGKVEIEVTARGKNVEIKVHSESDVAKSAIEGKFADLKHSLQTQDLNLSKLEVHVGTKADLDTGSTAGFSNPQMNQQSYAQSQERFSQSEGHFRNNAQSSTRPNIAVAAPMVSSMRSRAVAPGRVDIRI